MLRHPNIVGVLDVKQVADGRPYIVAELPEGHQLGDYLFDGAFHSDTSGVAWPGWGLIIFLGAALTGGVSAWRTLRFREFAE